MSTTEFSLRRLAVACAALAVLGYGPTALTAQGPNTYFACYVPLTGTVYRIREGNLKTACTTGHVEFSWTDGANAVRTTDPLGGDLSGVFSNANVVRLLGRALSTTAPQNGEVLMWDGTNWKPSPPPAGGSQVMRGDVTGTTQAATVVGLRGQPIDPTITGAQPGQILQYDGVSWILGFLPSHSQLSGLSNDDHPQYLLGNGVRNSTDGFVVTGTLGSGQLLASGAGPRLLWYPAKAAFRAGRVLADAWDDSNIGSESIALGRNPRASGFASIALGEGALASGQAAAAIGFGATASGLNAIALGQSAIASSQSAAALGFGAIASGGNATAIGENSLASGHQSIAIGNASTNGQSGAVVIADDSGFPQGVRVSASTPNQFVVRAQHFWFGTSNAASNPVGHFLTTSTGAFLSTGGAWTNASDVKLKNAFNDVDADDVLNKIARLPIRSWSYKAEDPSVRHVGPTAQDFRAAFGLGHAETSIATVDADGISLLGIQALQKRTRELERENKELRARFESENSELRARLERLEAALRQLQH